MRPINSPARLSSQHGHNTYESVFHDVPIHFILISSRKIASIIKMKKKQQQGYLVGLVEASSTWRLCKIGTRTANGHQEPQVGRSDVLRRRLHQPGHRLRRLRRGQLADAVRHQRHRTESHHDHRRHSLPVSRKPVFFSDEQDHISIAGTAHSFVMKQLKSSINNSSWGKSSWNGKSDYLPLTIYSVE